MIMEHKKNSYTDQQNALLARNEGWIIHLQDHENDTPCTKDGTESDGCTDGEWNGEGLPSVGTTCLVKQNKEGLFLECDILFMGDDWAMVRYRDLGELPVSLAFTEFNPIQTPKQKTVAAAYKLIKDCSSTMEMLDSLHDFGFLYDSAEKKNV
jgi:hypothetical protein